MPANLAAALKLVAANPLIIIFSALLDALFLFMYGFATQPVRDRLFLNAAQLAEVAGQTLQAQQFQSQSLLSILFMSGKTYTLAILFWLFVLLLVIYVIYTLLQGTSWHVAAQTAGCSRQWKEYVSHFALLNIPWFLILGLLFFALTIVDLRAAIAGPVEGSLAALIPNIALIGLMAVVAYLAVLSYADLQQHSWEKSFKNSFRRGTNRFFQLFPAILVLIVAIVIVNFALTQLSRISPAAALVVGIALVLPFLFFVRVYINTLFVPGNHGYHEHH